MLLILKKDSKSSRLTFPCNVDSEVAWRTSRSVKLLSRCNIPGPTGRMASPQYTGKCDYLVLNGINLNRTEVWAEPNLMAVRFASSMTLSSWNDQSAKHSSIQAHAYWVDSCALYFDKTHKMENCPLISKEQRKSLAQARSFNMHDTCCPATLVCWKFGNDQRKEPLYQRNRYRLNYHAN